MIKKIAIFSTLLAFMLFIVLTLKLDFSIAMSALGAHILLIVNILGLYFMWGLFFKKKSIALGVVLIILKYPLLGYIVYKAARLSGFSSLGFIIGFIGFLSSIVIVAILNHFKKL